MPEISSYIQRESEQINYISNTACKPKPKTYDELKSERLNLGFEISNLKSQIKMHEERIEVIDKTMAELKPAKLALLEKQMKNIQVEIDILKA